MMNERLLEVILLSSKNITVPLNRHKLNLVYRRAIGVVRQLTLRGSGRTKAAAWFKVTCRRCALPLDCQFIG